MSKQPTLTDLTSILNAGPVINNNNDEIQTAFDNTLSRDGSTPNQMNADIDLNGHDLLNVNTIQALNFNFNGLDFQGLVDQANAAAIAALAAISDIVFAFDTVADLLADTGLGYTVGPGIVVVSAGDFLDAEDYKYQVADSAATDHHLITANGVKVYALPHAGQFNVRQFGAVVEGADISAVMEKAMEASFVARNVTLTFPKGRFLLNSLVDAAFPTGVGTGNPVHVITIDGSGCVLEVPSSNTAGAIKITVQNNFQQLRIRNIEIQSAALIGVSADPTNGTGIEVYSALRPGDVGWGTTAAKQIVLENVHVVSKAPASAGRWDEGIRVDGFWFPELSHCWVNSRHPGNDDDLLYESGDGIAIWNCFSPILTSCYSVGRFMHNIRIDEDEDMLYEDFQLTGCYGVGARDALGIRMSSAASQAASLKEPGGRVSGGHYNGHRRAISVEHRRQFTIDGPLLYTTIPDSQVDYADGAFVYLNDCFDADVSVQVPEGGHYVSDVDCTRHVHLVGDTDYVRIHDCKFGAKGIAIANSSVGTNNIVENNDYKSYGATGTSAPTKRLVDPSALVRGGDIVVSSTPIIEFGGANVGMTFSQQDGGYHQQGRVVTFWADVRLSAKGSSTGDASIVLPGLPTPVSGSDFSFDIAYSTSVVDGPLGGTINSSAELELFHLGAGNTVNQRMNAADFVNVSQIRVSGTYLAA